MSKGTTLVGKLKLPKSVHGRAQGTTGARFHNLKGESPEIVRQYIFNQANEKNYGKYVPDNWDCEDYCFLAAADVRRKYQRQPIGIAMGLLGEDPHAVNILWRQDADMKWQYWLYDPTFHKEVTQEFKINAIVPIPICSSQNPNDYLNELPPKKFGFNKDAAFILDEKGSYKHELIDQVKVKLTQWAKNKPMYPNDGIFIDTNYYKFNDTLFYWFAHIRAQMEFRGAPIGVAFGKHKGVEDRGALILWKNPDEFTYWNIYAAEEFDDDDFEPRVVIA